MMRAAVLYEFLGYWFLSVRFEIQGRPSLLPFLPSLRQASSEQSWNLGRLER